MSMKIGYIGTLGHGGTAFAGKLPCTFIGVAAGCEADAASSRSLAESKGIPFFERWEDLLREKPDACVVNTVYGLNQKIALACLNAGIHVYCEKPAAISLEELDELEAVIHSENAPLYFSMLTERFEPCFYTARKLLDAGAVGEIRMLTAQKSYKLGTRPAFYKERSLYGGTIPWVAIHMIDQILWLSGLSVEDTRAWQSRLANGGNGSMEMTTMLQMRLSGEVLASVHADFLRPQNAPTHGDDRIRVAGTKGILEVRGSQVYLIDDTNNGTEPMPLEQTEQIFDAFIRLCGNKSARKDSIYRDFGALRSTRAALLARNSADRA